MAVNSVFSMTAAGTVCGAPFNINLGYKQIAGDVDGKLPHESLVEGWFSEANSPWRNFRVQLTNQLAFDCVSVTGEGIVVTFFLTDAFGLAAELPLPSNHCMMVVCPPRIPNTTNRAGRFFMPGFTTQSIDGLTWDSINLPLYDEFMLNLEQVSQEDLGAQEFRFSLMPHPAFTDDNGENANNFSGRPYFDPFVHRLKSRNVDVCGAFQGGNLSNGGDRTITVPPPPV